MFSRDERFHIVKLRFAHCGAQFENSFRDAASMEKAPQIQTTCGVI